MGALKHLLDAPTTPTPIPAPESARVERARREGGTRVWEVVEERPITGEADWKELLQEIGQRIDATTAYRARWVDRGGGTRRSAHFPVWQRP